MRGLGSGSYKHRLAQLGILQASSRQACMIAPCCIAACMEAEEETRTLPDAHFQAHCCQRPAPSMNHSAMDSPGCCRATIQTWRRSGPGSPGRSGAQLSARATDACMPGALGAPRLCDKFDSAAGPPHFQAQQPRAHALPQGVRSRPPCTERDPQPGRDLPIVRTSTSRPSRLGPNASRRTRGFICISAISAVCRGCVYGVK